jgi:N4-gp56 family major capsid protein
MATNTTTTLVDQYRRHYDTELLEKGQWELRLNQFGAKRPLPRGLGAKTIRFFRRMMANSANVQNIVEGVVINVFTDYVYEKVDVDLIQIGEAMRYTDVAGWTALLDILDDGIMYLGENLALKADDMTWGAICHPTTGLTKRYTGATQTFAGVDALTGVTGKYVTTDGLSAVTRLKINKAPKKNGFYVGIVGPQVAHDIQQDTRWLNVHTYSANTELFNGEIGKLDGIRYVETNNVWSESTTEGTRDITGAADVFASVFTGTDAYGVVELSGKGPNSPKIEVIDKADKSDPLNQLLICGWSAYYNSAVLNPQFGVVHRSKTSFV